MKRILFIIAIIVVIFGVQFAFVADAAPVIKTGETGECKWNIEGSVLIVTGKGEMGDLYSLPWGNEITDAVICEGVTHIGNYAFRNCSKLKNIMIADTVKTIGTYAFEGCTSLEKIVLPDSIVSLGEKSTFYGCTSLKSIVIGKDLSFIGELPFYGCTSLERISIDRDNLFFDSRENCNGVIETETNTLVARCKNTVIPESVKALGNMLFYRDTSLENIIIPEGITDICNSAFSGCTALKEISFSGSVERIGQWAFENCCSVERIELKGNIKTIDYMAFKGCVSLKELVLGSSVERISEGAFFDCPNLNAAYLPRTVKYIGNDSFGYMGKEVNPERKNDFVLQGLPDSKARKYAEENGFVFEYVFKGGDINEDGKLTVEDATLIQRILVGIENNEIFWSLGDVDENGSVDVSDVTYLQLYLVNR